MSIATQAQTGATSIKGRASTPLEKMRIAFPDAHQRRNGWWTNDDNPRFDFLELPNGDIRLNSWTGRTDDTILSMGKVKLTRADLYAKEIVSQVQERDKLDLPTLAQYMKIDWRFLLNIGYSDGYSYEYPDGRKVTCVKLGGYDNPDGTPYSKNKVRVDLHKEPRFLWDAGSPGPAIPCGLHRLDEARDAGYLIIGEGESDAATCWYHGLPFLGISGASTIANLDVDLLAGIRAIYIIEEPDQVNKLQHTGQGFYKDVRKHLRANDYTGAIYSIRFEDATGYKDPSDLHKAIYAECKEQEEAPFWTDVHTRFVQVIEAARENAIPEGNESLQIVQVRQEELNLEEWLWQAITAKKEALSDRDIRWCIYLCLYMRKVERGELGWHLDYEQIAFDLETTAKKVSEVLCYLADKVGLFVKHTISKKEYIGESQEVRHKGQDVYITPTYTFKRLRDACAPLQDQHMNGGPREKSEPALPVGPIPCEWCGNVHTTPYGAYCKPCDHVTYPPIGEDAETVDTINSSSQEVVVSTAEVLPLSEETACEADSPVSPKLGYTGNSTLESNSKPQTGVYGKFASDEVLFPLVETPSYRQVTPTVDDVPPASAETATNAQNGHHHSPPADILCAIPGCGKMYDVYYPPGPDGQLLCNDHYEKARKGIVQQVRGGADMKRNTVLATVDQIRSLKVSLRMYKAKVASQERQISRMMAASPCQEHEKEIKRLEERCEDLTRLLEDAESEIRMLKKQLRGAA